MCIWLACLFVSLLTFLREKTHTHADWTSVKLHSAASKWNRRRRSKQGFGPGWNENDRRGKWKNMAGHIYVWGKKQQGGRNISLDHKWRNNLAQLTFFFLLCSQTDGLWVDWTHGENVSAFYRLQSTKFWVKPNRIIISAIMNVKVWMWYSKHTNLLYPEILKMVRIPQMLQMKLNYRFGYAVPPESIHL